MNNNIKPIIVGMIIGGILTVGAYSFMAPYGNSQQPSSASDEKNRFTG